MSLVGLETKTAREATVGMAGDVKGLDEPGASLETGLPPKSELVRLRIGERDFTTTVGTLCYDASDRRRECLFTALLRSVPSGESGTATKKKAWENVSLYEGALFIDRPGYLFALVLDWLRTGRLPTAHAVCTELVDEALWFSIDIVAERRAQGLVGDLEMHAAFAARRLSHDTLCRLIVPALAKALLEGAKAIVAHPDTLVPTAGLHAVAVPLDQLPSNSCLAYSLVASPSLPSLTVQPVTLIGCNESRCLAKRSFQKVRDDVDVYFGSRNVTACKTCGSQPLYTKPPGGWVIKWVPS